MARKLYYGPNEIAIRDEEDLPALLDRIQEAANSGDAQWVEIRTKGDPHRILIQQGVPVFVVGSNPGGGGAVFL